MKYLLDTNICVYWLTGDLTIEQRALVIDLKHIAISFITLSELYYGAYKSQRVEQNLTAIKSLEKKLKRIDSNKKICETFGNLKSGLEKDLAAGSGMFTFVPCLDRIS